MRPIECAKFIHDTPADELIEALYFMTGYRPQLMGELCDTMRRLREEGAIECARSTAEQNMSGPLRGVAEVLSEQIGSKSPS